MMEKTNKNSITALTRKRDIKETSTGSKDLFS